MPVIICMVTEHKLNFYVVKLRDCPLIFKKNFSGSQKSMRIRVDPLSVVLMNQKTKST